MDKNGQYDMNKMYADFIKVTFILRSGIKLDIKCTKEDYDKITLKIAESMAAVNGTNDAIIAVSDYNGINPKTTMLRVSAIDVVQV